SGVAQSVGHAALNRAGAGSDSCHPNERIPMPLSDHDLNVLERNLDVDGIFRCTDASARELIAQAREANRLRAENAELAAELDNERARVEEILERGPGLRLHFTIPPDKTPR